MIKLSTDWKILEFNPEAEKFFGKKREDAVNQNYIQIFIPEQLQKKTENDLNKLQNKLLDGKLKMKVKAAGDNIQDVKCTINVLMNNMKMAAGIILSLKK